VALANGTVILTGDSEFYGSPVMVASRLAEDATAIADQVLVSEGCFDSIIQGGLPVELG
jgi:class 3 adenylate cyclase